MGNFKYDLTGQRFGRWLVLQYTGKNTSDHDSLWLCRCDCGKEKAVRGSSLRKGTSKGCGCVRRPAQNLIGQRFGKLTVLNITSKRDSNGSIIWHCKCDCGNECDRGTSTLHRKSVIHSCGCSMTENMVNAVRKDLTGQRFGKLTVLQSTEERSSRGHVLWKCQCDCGNICFVDTGCLTQGNTSSCGCINYSIGEKNIETILKKNNILFKSQYSTSELAKKRFDFAILSDDKNPIRFIEFDGRQHFDDISGIWNSPESLKDIQERDQRKNEYALSHNIPLVRIPYWERDNITLDMILGDKYLIKS